MNATDKNIDPQAAPLQEGDRHQRSAQPTAALLVAIAAFIIVLAGTSCGNDNGGDKPKPKPTPITKAELTELAELTGNAEIAAARERVLKIVDRAKTLASHQARTRLCYRRFDEEGRSTAPPLSCPGSRMPESDARR